MAPVSPAFSSWHSTSTPNCSEIPVSTSKSSGGSSIDGEGDSIGASGIAATNVVLSGSSARIEASDVSAVVDVIVDADNISQIDAFTKSLADTEGDSYSFLLAFNTVGYRPQNLLFNTVDALLRFPDGR